MSQPPEPDARARGRRIRIAVAVVGAVVIAAIVIAAVGPWFRTAPTNDAAGASTSTPGASPSGSPNATGGSGDALIAAQALATHARASRAGFDRKLFGDQKSFRDATGCPLRDSVLRQWLTAITNQPGKRCAIATGTLNDPYTGTPVAYVRTDVPPAVVFDRVVSLADAWQTGAQSFTAEQRQTLANDPLGFIPTTPASVKAHGSRGAVAWLPPNAAFRCDYVARQVAFKTKYHLWVTPPEKATMLGVLSACPNQALPTTG